MRCLLLVAVVMVVGVVVGACKKQEHEPPPAPRAPAGPTTIAPVDAGAPAPAERPDTSFHVRTEMVSGVEDPQYADFYEATARCRPDEQLTGGGCESDGKYRDLKLLGIDHHLHSSETFGAGYKCRDSGRLQVYAFCLSETKH